LKKQINHKNPVNPVEKINYVIIFGVFVVEQPIFTLNRDKIKT